MKKRSVMISGHQTSVTLEDEFWTELQKIAARKKLSVGGLISEIDQTKSTNNLSSAIRIFVLQSVQQSA